jgi:3-dehydroquinate dehydratase/shikimate dehydrogenase
MQQLMRMALRLTRTVELRLDWLRDDRERKKFLNWLARARLRNAVLLATCRRRIAGGEFSGDAGAELFWLMKAREAGCQWCDLEIETLRELPAATVRAYSVPEKVLLSIHDFRRTPRLTKKLNVPPSGGVDGVKVAAMARSIADSVRLLRWARKSPQAVAISMGEIGMPARILALREGSALTYAPVEVATAPGQVQLRDLKELYRAHQLTHKTQVYGVIGNPIAHSLSPLLHNTGYIAAGRNAVFLPFLVERLADFLKAVPDFGIRGFSVTLPHKEAVFRRLDASEPLAAKIGAVNTVTVRRDGSLYGSNTDYLGVLRALEKKMKLAGTRVLVFGAGGSARAAAFALANAGAQVLISARRDTAARSLARAVAGEAVPRAALRKSKFDAILNATPVGMHPQVGASPLAAGELNCSVVMDLIYRPMQTKLLQMAAARGITTVSGVEMFLAQGMAQWELWMGTPAPEAAMRKAVLGALKEKESSRP